MGEFGQIPTYEEGELALFETGAIAFHIAQRFPALLPRTHLDVCRPQHGGAAHPGTADRSDFGECLTNR